MTARRDALAAALARLREVLQAPETDVSRDAAIQRFEFSFLNGLPGQFKNEREMRA